MRIAKMTINSDYVQTLKNDCGDRFVFTPNVVYNSVLLRNTHRNSSNSEFKAKIWAKFDTSDFDGIHVMSYIDKNNNVVLQGGTCTIDVYQVSNDNLWTETLLHSTNSSSGPYFKFNITASFLTGVDLDGEFTLAIKSTITRRGRVFKNKVYINHLGTYDSIVRLRNKVKFLEITKKDYGVP